MGYVYSLTLRKLMILLRGAHTHNTDNTHKDCVEARTGQGWLMQSGETFWRREALSWA